MKSCGILILSALGSHLVQTSQSTAAHLEQEVMAHAFRKGLGKVNAPVRHILIDKLYFGFTGQQATSLSPTC